MVISGGSKCTTVCRECGILLVWKKMWVAASDLTAYCPLTPDGSHVPVAGEPR